MKNNFWLSIIVLHSSVAIPAGRLHNVIIEMKSFAPSFIFLPKQDG
jgi:hypothetical protein